MEQEIRRMTLSKAFQITLPSDLRRKFHLEAGDEIEAKEAQGGILLKKALSREEQVKAVFAELDKIRAEQEARMTPEQKEFAKKTAGWTANQYREYIDNLPETKAYIKEKYGV